MDNLECLPETEPQRLERIRRHLIAISWWLRGRASLSHDAMIDDDLPWSYILSLDEVIEMLGDCRGLCAEPYARGKVLHTEQERKESDDNR